MDIKRSLLALQQALRAVAVHNGEGERNVGRDLRFQVRGDFLLLFTHRFLDALHAVMPPGEGYRILCVNPDPIDYFYRHFGLLPLLDFAAGTRSTDILRALSQGPEQSPADSIGTRGDLIALVPASHRWVVLADREEDAVVAGFQTSEMREGFMAELERQGGRAERI